MLRINNYIIYKKPIPIIFELINNFILLIVIDSEQSDKAIWFYIVVCRFFSVCILVLNSCYFCGEAREAPPLEKLGKM